MGICAKETGTLTAIAMNAATTVRETVAGKGVCEVMTRLLVRYVLLADDGD
jgi:hypothetical protein